MSNNLQLTVRPIGAEQAIAKLANLAALLFPDVDCTLSVYHHFSQLNESVKRPGSVLEQNIDTLLSNLDKCKLIPQSISLVSIYQHRSRTISYTVQNGWKGIVQIDGHDLEKKDLMQWLSHIADAFDVVPESELITSLLPEPIRFVMSAQQGAIESLQVQTAKIAAANLENIARGREFINEAARDLHNRYEEREKERLQAHDARMAEVLAQREQWREAHEKQLELIQKDREKLEAERREMDLRKNTDARRRHLKELQYLLESQQEFDLSSKTQKKRILIHVLYGLAALASVALAGTFGYFLFTRGVWAYAAGLSGGVIGFFSTMIWYIRWTDQWFKEHARAEMMTRKFSTDILRASWLVEMLFETKENAVSVPSTLLTELSRGLFIDKELRDTPHPVDTLEELMRKVSTIKLGPDGVEISKGNKS